MLRKSRVAIKVHNPASALAKEVSPKPLIMVDVKRRIEQKKGGGRKGKQKRHEKCKGSDATKIAKLGR